VPARGRRLTREPLLLQLQADAAGVPVERGASTRRPPVRQRSQPSGRACGRPPPAIADRIPTGERFEPRKDAAWRETEHARWREFVEARSGALTNL
jgi:glycerol kinase